jgi:alpha-glucosidase
VLGNHDQPRVASRVGADQARGAAMLLLTLRGTPTLYYGDELGLPDVEVPPARVVDVDGRDPERSPMPWDDGPNGGFSTARPWLPMVEDPAGIGVAAQRDDPTSMLTLHRRLLALRRAEPALHAGAWLELAATDGTIAYDRVSGERTLRVVLNLATGPRRVSLDGGWAVVLSTGLDREGEAVAGGVELSAGEGLILEPA